MSRVFLVLVAALAFAIVNTVFLGVHLLAPENALTAAQAIVTTNGTTSGLHSTTPSTFQFFLVNSPLLSSASWVFVGGIWIWRGRTRSRWESLGFDSGIFDLFIKMRGAKTRMSLLDSLSMPKDRFQLAQELGLDWKAVDYHIILLNKYGLVSEDHAYGNVKMYQLTKQGEILLQLLREFNKVPSGAELASPAPKSISSSAQS